MSFVPFTDSSVRISVGRNEMKKKREEEEKGRRRGKKEMFNVCLEPGHEQLTSLVLLFLLPLVSWHSSHHHLLFLHVSLFLLLYCSWNIHVECDAVSFTFSLENLLLLLMYFSVTVSSLRQWFLCHPSLYRLLTHNSLSISFQLVSPALRRN